MLINFIAGSEPGHGLMLITEILPIAICHAGLFNSMHAAFYIIDWPDIIEPMNTLKKHGDFSRLYFKIISINMYQD